MVWQMCTAEAAKTTFPCKSGNDNFAVGVGLPARYLDVFSHQPSITKDQGTTWRSGCLHHRPPTRWFLSLRVVANPWQLSSIFYDHIILMLDWQLFHFCWIDNVKSWFNQRTNRLPKALVRDYCCYRGQSHRVACIQFPGDSHFSHRRLCLLSGLYLLCWLCHSQTHWTKNIVTWGVINEYLYFGCIAFCCCVFGLPGPRCNS